MTPTELASIVENACRSDNALDVMIEVALFKPNSTYSAVRADDMGTDVIYTDHAGNEVICPAEDWTLGQDARDATAAILKAEK